MLSMSLTECQSRTLKDMVSVSQFVSRQNVSLNRSLNSMCVSLSLSVSVLVFVIVDTEKGEIKSH